MECNYHIHESDIKCPYCDEDCYDDDYTVSQNLEERIEFECEHCDKKFYAEASIAFSTYADCELNGKEHDLEETHIKGFFKCRVCEYYTQKKNPAHAVI